VGGATDGGPGRQELGWSFKDEWIRREERRGHRVFAPLPDPVGRGAASFHELLRAHVRRQLASARNPFRGWKRVSLDSRNGGRKHDPSL